MSALFAYPRAAEFGRVVPKSKIYARANASSKLKKRFVDQINQIIWQYKLAPETINLDPTKAVREIQIFRIELRAAEVDEDVLRSIDRSISFPIIFELSHDSKRRTVAAYKRPSEADSTKWVVSEYFYSDWESEDNPREPLPAALNLGKLYDRLLSELLPVEAGADESVAARVERAEAVRAKQREIERIMLRLAREKQFNKRVAINAELREATNELKNLGSEAFAKG